MTAPSASRPRAFWSDARFLLGIVLVATAVAGVWFVVAAARQTVPVLAADRVITPGETLDADDLRVVEVGIAALEDAYVRPGALEPGAVATRTIGVGELVPAAGVTAPASLRVTTVVAPVSQALPAAVEPGVRVEVWSADQSERGVFDRPRVLIDDATVRAVRIDEGVVARSGAVVELVVDRADVAAVLGAVADGDAISVVPVGAP